MTLVASVKQGFRLSKPKKRTTSAGPPSVIEIIEDRLRSYSQPPLHFFRPSMIGGCLRANVFHYLHAPETPPRIDLRIQRILDNGTAVHELIQDKYLSYSTDYWFVKEPKVQVRIGFALVRGSSDGTLIRRRDLYRWGVEIKTINHDDFMRLTGPQPSHVMQASLYCKLQRLPCITVLYWDKDKQHMREYVVYPDDGAWQETKKLVLKMYGYVVRSHHDPSYRKGLPVFSPQQCNPTFCHYVDHCRKMGGRPPRM